jgi:hypothetical protein
VLPIPAARPIKPVYIRELIALIDQLPDPTEGPR